MSSRDKIQALQTELLQDFFEIQMTANYPSWKNEVYNVVVRKQSSPYSTYDYFGPKAPVLTMR